MNDLWRKLINKIVTSNGEGHALLQKHINEGLVSEEEGSIIKLRASAILLEQRLSMLAEKIEAL